MFRSAFVLVLPFVMNASVQTNVTRMDVDGSFSERRTKLHPDAPSVSAEFRLEGRTIVGRLKTRACKTSRTWVSQHVVTTHTRGNTVAALSLMTAGAVAITAAGAVSRPDPDQYTCRDVPSASQTLPDRVECGYPHQDPTLPTVLAISGAAAALTGLALLLWPEKTRTIAAPSVRHE